MLEKEPHLSSYDARQLWLEIDKKVLDDTGLNIKGDYEITQRFFAGLLLGGLMLTACNNAPSGENSQGGGEGNNYSQILKDAATEIMQLNAAPAVASRWFAPQEAFVAASDYCDDITAGTDFDVEIYTGEE